MVYPFETFKTKGAKIYRYLPSFSAFRNVQYKDFEEILFFL